MMSISIGSLSAIPSFFSFVLSKKSKFESSEMGLNNEASSSSHVLQLPREETPLLGNQSQLSSQPKTFANIFIAIVGAGMLGLPYTFKKAGWIMGSLMIFSVALLTYHSMMLLVITRRKLQSLHDFSRVDSFGDLGFAVWGPLGRFAVDAMIVLAQVGFCVSYLIFLANTLAVVFSHGETLILGLRPKTFYLWTCFPFQLGLNSVKTLTHLAPLSIFADVVDLGAIGVVMVKDLLVFFKNKQTNWNSFGGFSVFFYSLGVALYSFEGIAMILPLELEAKDKDKFGKVLGLSMAFISFLLVAFGVLGYWAYGEETKDIITNNLGPGLLSILVQLGLAVNLFVSFPLMMNPVYEAIERRFCESRYCLWLRWLVVFGVSFVALLVPNFADFLSLVGSSVLCVLGIVFPPAFHLMVFRNEVRWNGLILDVVIVVLGVVMGVSGTFSSLMEIFAAKA